MGILKRIIFFRKLIIQKVVYSREFSYSKKYLSGTYNSKNNKYEKSRKIYIRKIIIRNKYSRNQKSKRILTRTYKSGIIFAQSTTIFCRFLCCESIKYIKCIGFFSKPHGHSLIFKKATRTKV